jgi:hypothetical protein
MEEFMEYRDLSFAEAIKSLQDSLQSEFDEERIVAQILLKGYKNEEIKKYKNHLPCERMGRCKSQFGQQGLRTNISIRNDNM